MSNKTLDECLEICKKCENFTCKKSIYDGSICSREEPVYNYGIGYKRRFDIRLEHSRDNNWCSEWRGK